MLLRVRSPEGTFRIQVEASTSGEEFAKKVLETIPASTRPVPSSIKLSNQPRGGEQVTLDALTGRNVGDMGFSHGDMLFLSYEAQDATPAVTEESALPAQPTIAHTLSGETIPVPANTAKTGTVETASIASLLPIPNLSHIKEDPVDEYWRNQDGKIQRKRDEKFCRHGAKGMCDYCMPLEPFDATYQASNQIKHLSYHAYLRKLLSSATASSASSSYIPPLTPLDYRVTVPCTSGSHPSWPAGICSKCQPSAITLQSQPFRMVDHVEFASPTLIDNFLSAWRRTGLQRFGLLIGRLGRYEKVPMGIKAVVEAIHEVAQEGEVDGLTLGESWHDEEKRANEIAKLCVDGLHVVGMIYTDLTPEPEDKRLVQYKRHPQSFYMSSLELIFAAHQQLAHPNPTRSSPTGTFSSRFVTCVLTGTEDGGIDILAFQATEQAVAMVQADMIEASVDPGTVRVKREEDARYVPDVFFTHKNDYGIQIKENAKPCFPVEYLLVNVTHGFPVAPNPLFLSSDFPIENRPGLHDQSVNAVCKQLAQVLPRGSGPDDLDATAKDKLQRTLSDWHLLFFMAISGMLAEDETKLLARTASAHETNDQNALDELLHTGGWQTVMLLTEEQRNQAAAKSFGNDGFEEIPAHLLAEGQAGGSSSGGAGASSGGTGPIACPHCTYENPAGSSDCEVCGLPLRG